MSSLFSFSNIKFTLHELFHSVVDLKFCDVLVLVLW